MSVMGHKRTSTSVRATSALFPNSDNPDWAANLAPPRGNGMSHL